MVEEEETEKDENEDISNNGKEGWRRRFCG